MSYTVLARRYRSATFDEIVGQEHIARTLKKAIESGRIAHAYLFCGTRGTGKTSTARILAKSLNCLKADGPTTKPCGKCDSCVAIARGDDLDVIEIDAASHTGVDNVREIIENSQYRPARARFKIYIIDEVHMLSKSAFNALLKTLEEPPSHVKFILATTEPEKVLPTILSRCQRYDFRNIPASQIAAHLTAIAKEEKVDAEPAALALVARAGNGSMRDSLSLLDRLLSLGDKRLTAESVEQMLGLPRAQLVADLAGAIAAGDVKAVLSQADAMLSAGLSAEAMSSALGDHLRNLLVARTCGADSALLDVPGQSPEELTAQAQKFDPVALAQDIAILEELRRNLRFSQTGRALLDATLVRLAMADQFVSIGELLSQPAQATAVPQPQQKKKPEVASAPPPIQTVVPPAPPVPVDSPVPTDLWGELLAAVEKQAAYLGGVLRQTRFGGVQDGMAVIHFPAAQATFAEKWSANGKKDILAKALSDIRGEPTGVRFEVQDESPAVAALAPVATPVDSDPLVQFVLSEFGGRVVSQSD